ncbi:MAG TPA: nucleotidyltransferase family protein [Bacteroidales bacterium]|nr:nucleotidyltransferase family protein [Bacteroidales bacterium]HQO08213.1 nucleotidyltransferase family protein [Bacteroidales bacterium]HQP54280.1 nucleotidyltransferase family protein [Bacteroidales bacterium]
MISEAVILAGGFGTRLSSVLQGIPKPMAPVNGRPFLDYQMAYLAFHSIKRVILSVGYLHDQIISHYGNRFGNIDIVYSIEHEPLGTGGAIKKALLESKENPVLVLNGDTFFELDLREFHDFYRRRNTTLTIAMREVNDTSCYGSIEVDWNGRITGFYEKSESGKKGKINGGIYLIDKNFLFGFNLPDKFSIEKDFFEKIYRDHNIYAMLFKNYFIDIGVPEEYSKTKDDFRYFRYF